MLHMAQMGLTAVYMKVPEGYIAFVEELAEESIRGADVIRETLFLPAA